MTNLEDRFSDFRLKMSKKSERERHNFALTVALLMGSVVLFFVASSWYFRISGDSYDTSFFTKLEDVFNQQRGQFTGKFVEFSNIRADVVKTLNGEETVYTSSSTNPNSTSTNLGN